MIDLDPFRFPEMHRESDIVHLERARG